MTEQNKEPIPVKKAMEAVQAAIEVCKQTRSGKWAANGMIISDQAFIAAARAVLPGALEFVLWMLQEMQDAGGIDDLDARRPIYSAVAPIVAWHRAQKESVR